MQFHFDRLNMINYRCPHCNEMLRMPVQYAGRTGKCNKCGERITIPKTGPTTRAVRFKRTLVAAFSKLNVPSAGSKVLFLVVFVISVLSISFTAWLNKTSNEKENRSERRPNYEGLKPGATFPDSLPPEVEMPNYRIVETDDISYGTVKRYQIRIVVDEKLSREAIQQISDRVVAKYKSQKPFNALGIFFYLKGTDFRGQYTAGKVEYAPNGEWSDADSARIGDYSKHRFNVKVGNAFGAYQSPTVSSISAAKKRQIFKEIVKEQEKGGDQSGAKYRVGRRYGTDEETTDKIVVEGVLNGWPMR